MADGDQQRPREVYDKYTGRLAGRYIPEKGHLEIRHGKDRLDVIDLRELHGGQASFSNGQDSRD